MNEDQNRVAKWAGRLNSRVPFLCARIRRAACRKLASDKTVWAVPFLRSALASSDEEVRHIAEGGLQSLTDPQAIEALRLGYAFTEDGALRRILTALEGDESEVAQTPLSQPWELATGRSPAEQAWRLENSKDGSVLAFIPEGDFLTGPEGFWVHLPAYYLALACVTNLQYAQFLDECRPSAGKLSAWIYLESTQAIRKESNAYVADPESADLPVVWVTWEGAEAYCRWAGLRLPTELEWEKGARGVDGRQYPWGNEWEVGRPLPADGERHLEKITSVWAHPTACSPYGLYQMIGNVYEWCAGWYEEAAYQRYAQGDLRPSHGERRVLRGGPWRFGTPVYLRTEYRKSTCWRAGTLLCGFRCAKDL